MPLFVRCSYVNETKGHMIGEDPEPEEAFTDNRAKLFLAMQKECGRCISKMYRDTKSGTKEVGWVFSRREEYEDAHRFSDPRKKTYVREVWVEVFDRESKP